MKINAILLDIEGTVGPISFVHEVLFPYSTERMLDYLRKNPLDETLIAEILSSNQEDFKNGEFARIENPSDSREMNAYLQFLIREDRKFGPLKWIQGRIWKEGFELGDLRAELFEDVPKFLMEASKKGLRIFIYSSGSVEAQKLFFRYSVYGDLGKYLDGYYDTLMGPKQSKESYTNISKQVNIPPSNIVFFTDIVAEADAAIGAGFGKVIVMDRPGNKPQPEHGHPVMKELLSFLR